MPKGKTRSKLTREERLSQAFEGFAMGMSDVSIAKQLKVTRQTVGTYRGIYEERLSARARANPNLLRDVLKNTMRALEELDRIREEIWQHMQPRKAVTEHTCPECDAEFTEKEYIYVTDDTRSKYIGHLLKAQETRAKLLGVIGVKTEVIAAVMGVKTVADALMAFMAENLCAEDRAKLEELLMGPELRAYVAGDSNVLDVIDADVLEERQLQPA